MAQGVRQKEKEMSSPQRGEIYLVEFDPARGHEIQKTRPALIIQNDIGNRYSPVTIVAAITSQFAAPLHPTDVIVEGAQSGLSLPSAVVLNQIRSVDRQRLIRRLGRLEVAAMQLVDQAIKISLGLI